MKIHLKRIFCLIMALLISLLFVGCHSYDNPKGSEQESTSATSVYNITKATDNATNNNVQEEIKEYFLPEGYEIMYYTDPDHAPQNQWFDIYDPSQDVEDPAIDVPQSIEITANEKIYTATFYEKNSDTFSPRVLYFYDSEEAIFVTNGWGEPCRLAFFDNPAQGTILSKEECEQKAKAFFQQFFDISNYRMEIIDKTEQLGEYTFKFQKYFGEIPVYDIVYVSVKNTGYIQRLTTTRLKRVPDDMSLPSIDMEKVYSAVEYVYQKTLNFYKDSTVEFEFTEPELILIKGDEVAFRFECQYSNISTTYILKIPQT